VTAQAGAPTPGPTGSVPLLPSRALRLHTRAPAGAQPPPAAARTAARPVVAARWPASAEPRGTRVQRAPVVRPAAPGPVPTAVPAAPLAAPHTAPPLPPPVPPGAPGGAEAGVPVVQRRAPAGDFGVPAGIPVTAVPAPPVQRRTAPTSAPADAQEPASPSGAELDDLARRLIEPVARLLRTDLRRGRDRIGRPHDGRR
jgi:syndecan 1